MRHLVSILLLHFTFFIHAQTIDRFGNLLPIKVEAKWGFIDTNGNMVTEPKYDLIGKLQGSPIGRRYLVVMNNDKIGLLNSAGVEVLPTNFEEVVRIYSDSIFTVMDEGKLLVVNKLGATILDGKFEDIIPLNDKYFIVQENGLYGLLEKGNGYLIDPQYFSLKQLKRQKRLLKFSTPRSSEKELFGLIDFENNQILPPNFQHINYISDDYFLTNKEYFQLWERSGKRLLEDDKWKKATVISDAFITFTSESGQPKLFSISQKRFIEVERNYSSIEEFNDQFLIGIVNGKKGLLDQNGKEIIPPLYSDIQLYTDDIFKVREVHWGLFHIDKKIILPTDFTSIGRLKNNFASIKKKTNTGLISKNGEIILQPMFSNIEIDSAFVKGFQGQRMNLYQIEPDQKLTLLDVYPLVYTVRVGYDLDDALPNIDPWRTARSANLQRRRNRRKKKTPDFSQIENSDWEFYNDWGNWGLRQKSTDKIIHQPQFETVIPLPFTDLSAVYSYDKKIPANVMLQVMTTNPKKGAYGMALFSHNQGKFLNDFDLMGIRSEDFEYDYPVAACLNNEGKFIFINKKGAIVNGGKQYTHVGDFYDGHARVCLNGEIKNFDVVGKKGYEYGKSTVVKKNLNIRHNRFITAGSSPLKMYGGTWSFVDTFGIEMSNANFDYVNDFNNGNAICFKDNKYGVINKDNQNILDFNYRSIINLKDFLQIGVPNRRPFFYNNKGNTIVDWGYEKFTKFSEGLCAVRKNGKWGYVNNDGEEVIPSEFLSANNFKNDKASVQSKTGWYFINKKGEIVLDLRKKSFQAVGNFSEGLCWFKISRGEKSLYGFMNEDGEQVIDPIYTKAFDFEYGRARVAYKRKTGLIDKNGKFVLYPKRYDLVFPFNEYGVAKVQEDNMSEFGLIDLNGKELSPCKYLKINDFEEGLARVVVAKKGIGYIDTLGNEVIPPIYRSVGEFSEGLVTVQNEHTYQWQYVDANNKLAFNGAFAAASPFRSGFAIVRNMMDDALTNYLINKKGNRSVSNKKDLIIHFSEGKYGYQKFIKNAEGEIINSYCYFTDQNGKNIHEGITYRSIEPFENNTSLVESKARKWGMINSKGYEIIPNKFNRIFNLDHGIYNGIAAQLFGLTDAAGNIVLEPIYDQIKTININIIRVQQGSKIGYFTTDGNWLWQLQD